MAVLLLALRSLLSGLARTSTGAHRLRPLLGLAGNSFSVGIAWNAAWFSTASGRASRWGRSAPATWAPRSPSCIGPALIALVPAAWLLGRLVPGGWRFVPVLYTVLLVVMAAVLWLLAPAPDRRPGSARSVRRDAGAAARGARSGASASTTWWCSAPTWRSRSGCRTTTRRSSALPSAGGAADRALHLPRQPPASPRRLAVRSLRRPAGDLRRVRRDAARVRPAGRPDGRLAARPGRSSRSVEVLGVGMGIGKASVYKYIPELLPARRRRGRRPGRHAGRAGRLLPAARVRLPQQTTGRPGAASGSCWPSSLELRLWLHLVVKGLRRATAPRLAPEEMGAVDDVAGAGA